MINWILNPGALRGQRFTPFIVLLLLLSACATSPEQPSPAEKVRAELTSLQSDPELAARAPLVFREAELAVAAAEEAEGGTELAEHLVFVAERQVDIARTRAQTRLYEDQREMLREEREQVRLKARTDEAEIARQQARQAAMRAEASREEAAELRRQIEELNAKPTDRGLVLTLGDVLFETNQHEIKAGAHNDFERLAAFLERYPERNVRIEGHTDSAGSDDYNMNLSQRRADSVKSHLVSQGIGRSRITTSGRGESTPIASNDTVGGRQLNRRVEIIIENPEVSTNGNSPRAAGSRAYGRD